MAGHGVAGTAAQLTISMATTRTHIKRLHAKTYTHSLDGLVAWGYAHADQLSA